MNVEKDKGNAKCSVDGMKCGGSDSVRPDFTSPTLNFNSTTSPHLGALDPHARFSHIFPKIQDKTGITIQSTPGTQRARGGLRERARAHPRINTGAATE